MRRARRRAAPRAGSRDAPCRKKCVPPRLTDQRRVREPGAGPEAVGARRVELPRPARAIVHAERALHPQLDRVGPQPVAAPMRRARHMRAEPGGLGGDALQQCACANRAAGSAGSPRRRCGCRARGSRSTRRSRRPGTAPRGPRGAPGAPTASQCRTAATRGLAASSCAFAALVVREEDRVARVRHQLLAQDDPRRGLAIGRGGGDDHRVGVAAGTFCSRACASHSATSGIGSAGSLEGRNPLRSIGRSPVGSRRDYAPPCGRIAGATACGAGDGPVKEAVPACDPHMKSLEELRARLDVLDRQILELDRRAAVARWRDRRREARRPASRRAISAASARSC